MFDTSTLARQGAITIVVELVRQYPGLLKDVQQTLARDQMAHARAAKAPAGPKRRGRPARPTPVADIAQTAQELS